MTREPKKVVHSFDLSLEKPIFDMINDYIENNSSKIKFHFAFGMLKNKKKTKQKKNQQQIHKISKYKTKGLKIGCDQDKKRK